jgi:hypothetical protein
MSRKSNCKGNTCNGLSQISTLHCSVRPQALGAHFKVVTFIMCEYADCTQVLWSIRLRKHVPVRFMCARFQIFSNYRAKQDQNEPLLHQATMEQ